MLRNQRVGQQTLFTCTLRVHVAGAAAGEGEVHPPPPILLAVIARGGGGGGGWKGPAAAGSTALAACAVNESGQPIRGRGGGGLPNVGAAAVRPRLGRRRAAQRIRWREWHRFGQEPRAAADP